MPKEFNQGVLYISMEYSLVMHLCACGCGEKVATPLSPDDWKLYYDGELITLSPSVGNWDFPCRSHYWIKRNKAIFIENIKDWNIDRKSTKQKDLYNSIFSKFKKSKSSSGIKPKRKKK
jgi:hypothetical protein